MTKFGAFLVFFTPIGLVQAADPTAQRLSPDDAAKTMVLPKGFRATLFAAEPDVQQPISMCIDDRGRVWVAEAYNYPNRKTNELKDRILILEDADGDGRADKRTIFYDKLRYVTGIEYGFGGVFVMSPPKMLFIPDKNRDDKPDGEPAVLLDGFGHTTSNHNIATGFTWGPDGWLYGGHGRTSPSLVGKPGTPKDQRVLCDGGVYRYHPVRHVFEVFADGTTNPWGVDFNEYGAAFVSNCVTPHLHHMIQGGHYEPWRGRKSSQYAYKRLDSIADHKHYAGKSWQTSKKGLPDTLALGGGHAHAGCLIYQGDNWPAKYRGGVFMVNVHGKRLNHDILKRRGSGYVASHSKDFMFSKDPWFMGVTIDMGPDGAVYVTDWSDTGECHTNKPHRMSGRIFKVTYGQPKPLKVDLRKQPIRELADLLWHENQWHVRHARRLLQERVADGRRDAVIAHLLIKENQLRKSEEKNVKKALEILWTEGAIEHPDSDGMMEPLKNKSEYIRAWSIQLSLNNMKLSDTLLHWYVELAEKDPSPLVRLYLASACQRLSHERRWPILEKLVQHEADKDDANLPLMYWYAIEPCVPGNKAKALQLATKTKIPLIRQFIARRAAEVE